MWRVRITTIYFSFPNASHFPLEQRTRFPALPTTHNQSLISRESHLETQFLKLDISRSSLENLTAVVVLCTQKSNLEFSSFNWQKLKLKHVKTVGIQHFCCTVTYNIPNLTTGNKECVLRWFIPIHIKCSPPKYRPMPTCNGLLLTSHKQQLWSKKRPKI